MKQYIVIAMDLIFGVGLFVDFVWRLFHQEFEYTFYIALAFAFFMQYLHEVVCRKNLERCLQCGKVKV